jgi:dihydroorotate dehydrogenase electron transfer subunit
MLTITMKYQIDAKIIKNEQIEGGYFEIILTAKKIAQNAKPGQFVQMKVDKSLNPLLRRPFGLSFADKKEGEIGIIYQVRGKGTEILSQRKINETLSVIGPLGNGFWLEPNVKSVALIAGGSGVGPLIFLAQAMTDTTSRVKIFSFLGARSKNLLVGQKELQRYSDKVYLSTDDGSAGHYGFITDILEKKCLTHQIEQIITVGPMPMMQKVAVIGQRLNIPTQVSLEEKMACGFGACLGCVVKLKDGEYHMVCKDGSIFKGEDVV